ncbi:PaeR7I family type II restriction endonuclease [Algoriphagus sp. C2-6-M1]
MDLWTEFKENGFQQSQQPCLGYGLIVEKNVKSSTPVAVNEPYF